MLRKTIKFKDFEDEEIEQDFYFNLSKTELLEMQADNGGDLQSKLKFIGSSKDVKLIMATFKDILKLAYGVRSEDGKRFIKGEDKWEEFEQTNAYDALIMELLTDADAGAQFINGLLPNDLVQSTQANNQRISEEVRRLSEAAMQGHKQEAKGSSIVEVPELPTVKEEAPVDLNKLTKAQLLELLNK